MAIILSLLIAGLLVFLYIQSRQAPPNEGEGTNFIAKFNPFKSNVPPSSDEIPQTPETPSVGPEAPGETAVIKLKKVSSVPIAGFGLFKKERFKEVPVPPPKTEPAPPAIPPEGEVKGATTETKKTTKVVKATPPPTEFVTTVRYVERTTGNIYQTFVDKIEERKFSTTIIPKIWDAYWGSGGQSVVMRHLKPNEQTIETILGTLPKEKLGEDLDNNAVKGTFLSDDITDISLSPDNTKIFYLINVGQSAIGTIMNIADQKKTQVFQSDFTEWLSWWPDKNTVTLTTKPSGGVAGYMYTLDVSKKTVTRVLGPVSGLTTLTSPDGKQTLYSNGALAL